VHARLASAGAGKEVVTHLTDGARGVEYCRVLVDRYGTATELTYLGDAPVAGRNLGALVGLHASFLNALVARAEAAPGSGLGLPNGSLVDFFGEPWAEALGHEAFLPLSLSLRAALGDDAAIEAVFEQMAAMVAPTGDAEVDAVLDGARDATAAAALGATGDRLPRETRAAVEALLVEFLRLSTRSGVIGAYAV